MGQLESNDLIKIYLPLIVFKVDLAVESLKIQLQKRPLSDLLEFYLELQVLLEFYLEAQNRPRNKKKERKALSLYVTYASTV